MGLDLSRMAAAALESALDDGEPKHKPSNGLRTLAAGAALAAAARVAVTKGPSLSGGLSGLRTMAKLRDVPDRVRDRLTEAGWLGDDEEDQEPVDDEPVDEAEPEDDEELEDDEEELEEDEDEDEELEPVAEDEDLEEDEDDEEELDEGEEEDEDEED